MKLLAPSILSADFSKIAEDIKTVEKAGADILHMDVMDGHFVPNITFGPKMVKDVNKITDLPLDVHLMISNPENYVEDFINAGADWVSVHYETVIHLNRLINHIKERGAKAGVVINPATPVTNLTDILPYADFVLIMSVNPGFGGQKFISKALDKTKELQSMIKENKYNAFIEMDGGIGKENIREISNAGVNVFVAGNSVFGSEDPALAVKDLKKLIAN